MFIVPSGSSLYPRGVATNKPVVPNRPNPSLNQFHIPSRDVVHFKGQQEERLLSAAESGSMESFSKLLDEESINLDWQDSRGNTALMQAVGNADKVKALLDKGADPTIASHFGNTALMKASQVGNLASGKLLVAALKAKHNNFTRVINEEYNTALHLAASMGHTDVAKYLVEEGFSPTQLNLDKGTPIALAKENGHTETASTLKALSLQSPSRPKTDTQVTSLFQDVFSMGKTLVTQASQSSSIGTLDKPVLPTASEVTQSSAPILQKEPELSPYQTLLTTFMEGQSLFDCSPETVQEIIRSSDVLEEFALHIKDKMDQSEHMKAQIEKALCHEYFKSSGALQQFLQRVTQAVTERLPKELAQDYPETDALLKIAYPELQEKGRTKPRKFGFNSVVGLDKLKAHLRKHVIAPLTEPPDDEFELPKPNGILFFGPSRTGKTNLANALADEIGYKFKKVTSADIFSSLQGQPVLNVQKLFEEARADGIPTVLFIDEINQVVPNRRDVHTNQGDMARVVDEFLKQLDEAHKHGVFTIAATNLPTLLDNAVQQPGRLDTEIPIGLPDTKTKATLFPFFLKQYEQKPIHYEEGLFEELAAKAINFSPADIKEAVSIAIRDYRDNGKKPSIGFYLEKAVQETKPGNSKVELQEFQDYITEKGLKNAVDS